MESKELELECSRHSRFWMEDGNIVFRVSSLLRVAPCDLHNIVSRQVQDTLYKVHRYFFSEYSPVFCDMFSLPPASRDGAVSVEGETEENPIVLSDDKVDFDRLLNVFYPK